MDSPNKFYRLANQYLETLLKETCKVFSVDRFDIEIEQVTEQLSTPGFSGGIMAYSFFKTRKLTFFPLEFIKLYPYIKRKNSKFLNGYSLNDYVISNLSHEVSHKAHDVKTNFELGNQTKKLSSGYFKNPESKAIYTYCIGVADGVADFAMNVILKRLGLDKLADANRKCSKYDIEGGMEKNKNIEPQDIPDALKEMSFDESKNLAFLLIEHYQQKFEKEGLEGFRRFVMEWRPSQVSYYDATSLMIELFRQQQLRMFSKGI
jgi:hypothetical protein